MFPENLCKDVNTTSRNGRLSDVCRPDIAHLNTHTSNRFKYKFKNGRLFQRRTAQRNTIEFIKIYNWYMYMIWKTLCNKLLQNFKHVLLQKMENIERVLRFDYSGSRWAVRFCNTKRATTGPRTECSKIRSERERGHICRKPAGCHMQWYRQCGLPPAKAFSRKNWPLNFIIFGSTEASKLPLSQLDLQRVPA